MKILNTCHKQLTTQKPLRYVGFVADHSRSNDQ